MADTTPRLQLRRPVDTDFVTYDQDLNDNHNILDVAIDRVTTSASRPALPYTGMRAYETDTGNFIIFDGTDWVIFGSTNYESRISTLEARTTHVSTGNIPLGDRINAMKPVGAQVLTLQQMSSTAYADLTTVGPTVTLTTGTTALVFIYCAMKNATSNEGQHMSYEVSGATATRAASDAKSIRQDNQQEYRYSGVFLETGLTAGSNTFKAKYRRQAATVGDFFDRKIIVMPFGA